MKKKIVSASFNHNELFFPQHYKAYMDHMQLLNLFFIRAEGKRIANSKSLHKNVYKPSGFGQMFLNACVTDMQ
jgi:hypothetical protein